MVRQTDIIGFLIPKISYSIFGIVPRYVTLRKIIKIPQQGLDFSKSTLLIIPKVDQVENIFDWVSGQNLVIWLNHFQPQKNLLFLSHSFVWGLQQLVAATGCFSIDSITTTVLCK